MQPPIDPRQSLPDAHGAHHEDASPDPASAPHGPSARQSPDSALYPRATRQDWMLLGISLLFVVAGLVIVRGNPSVGIVTLAMFGSCALVFGNIILRKNRYRRMPRGRVGVAGGVPIRPPRGRFILAGAWIAGLGVLLVVFGGSYPATFRWLAGFVALLGFGLLLAVLLAGYPRQFLQFDPPGLTMGFGTWRVTIPWGAIVGMDVGELHSNPVLFLWVADVDSLEVQPPGARPRMLKRIATSTTWTGAHFTIMATQYRIDLPILAAAITRYHDDPAARSGLAVRVLPGT